MSQIQVSGVNQVKKTHRWSPANPSEPYCSVKAFFKHWSNCEIYLNGRQMDIGTSEFVINDSLYRLFVWEEKQRCLLLPPAEL